MIEHLLQPLICERFRTDARYREGHLRVVNVLPERRVVGLHSPEIKAVAKQLLREGGEVTTRRKNGYPKGLCKEFITFAALYQKHNYERD